jgi:hypothetical protein
MGQDKTWCSSGGQYFVLFFFFLYLNDLPNIIADLSKLVLFADDTSIITANPSPSKFKEYINSIIENISDWFGVNSLSLNFYKTYF